MSARDHLTIVSQPGHLTAPAIAAIRAAGMDVRLLPPGLSPDELAASARDAEILLVGDAALPTSAIGKLKRTKLIVKCGSGIDAINLEAAAIRGIQLVNVPDYCAEEVADHTILLMLAATKQLRHFVESWQRGEWSELRYPPVRRLQGQRLGIIGFGRIGSRVAVRARVLGLEVNVASPRADPQILRQQGLRRVSLDEAISDNDVISLHCPLNPGTRHLLNAARFATMRRGVVIVNTSRGGCIDLDALSEAIEKGIVSAAGLDVLDGEPYPNLNHPVLRHSSVFVTPHVAFYSTDARQELGARVAEEVIRYMNGEEPDHPSGVAANRQETHRDRDIGLG